EWIEPLLKQPGDWSGETLRARLGRSVATQMRVSSGPSFSQTEGTESVGSIDCQDAIEVIDLVLEQLGAIAFELLLMPAALHVLIANPYSIDTRDPDQQVGEGEAIVPDPEILVSYVYDLRVDQGP